MKKHGVFYCRYCKYQCPVKAPLDLDRQDELAIAFWAVVGQVPS